MFKVSEGTIEQYNGNGPLKIVPLTSNTCLTTNRFCCVRTPAQLESVLSQQRNHRATQWQRFAEGCFTDSKERPNKQTVQLCLNNIAYQNYLQGNSRLCCYHLKRKKMQSDSWIYCKKYKKCFYVNYHKQLHIKVKVTKGRYCQETVIKNRESC